ncbi:MAG: hypothetical protein U1F49_02355 [Rubrivivax sp.]
MLRRPTRNEAAAAAAASALTVTVVSPTTATWPQAVAANGSIFAWQEASVGAEAAGWRLAEVRAQVGDTVRRGQVLAVFATEIAEADLAQQRAALAEARRCSPDRQRQPRPQAAAQRRHQRPAERSRSAPPSAPHRRLAAARRWRRGRCA